MFNVFDLMATLRLDSSDYERGLADAEGGMSRLSGSIGSGLATAAKVGTAAIGAAATAVGALTKQAVDSYGEYQQLVGGVETLFKTSSDTVLKNAKNAFETAGVSANEYMNTVTSFSAALIQSTRQTTSSEEEAYAKAAQLADQALVDMSDNANKMGTNMESIQNAYMGFSKQNFTINYLMSAA